MYIKKHLNHFILFFITAALLTVAVFAGSFTNYSAKAADTVKAEAIGAPDGYYNLVDPAVLTVGSGGIFAGSSTASTVAAFSLSGSPLNEITTSAPVTHLAAMPGMVAALENGEAVFYKNGQPEDALVGPYDELSGYGEAVYLRTGNTISVYAFEEGLLTLSNTFTVDGTVLQIAATDGGAYVAIQPKKSYYDIYLYKTDGTSVKLWDDRAAITDMAAADNEQLIIATTGGIYQCVKNAPPALLIDNGTDAVSVHGSGIYFLDTDLNQILRYDLTTKQTVQLVATAGDAKGFFDTPMGLTTKMDTLAVAEYYNSRVAVIKADENGATFEYISMDGARPKSVAIDSKGVYYVCHNNKIDVFSGDFAAKTTVIVGDEDIVDVRTDAKNNVYVLSGGKLYMNNSDGGFTLTFSTFNIDAFAFAPGGNTIYALSGDSMYKIDSNRESQRLFTIDAALSPVSFAVDISGSFYLLSKGKVYKYYKDGDNYVLSLPLEYETGFGVSEGATSIIISTVKTGIINYGDLIISDTETHTVRRIDGKAFDVKVIDDDYTPPVVGGDGSANIAAEGILRCATADADFFAKPMEMMPAFSIAKGRHVIVIDYDLDESDAYSYVLAENAITKTLRAGYVYKDLLSDPERYTDPYNGTATTFSSNTKIYKWPSIHSEVIAGYSNLAKGDALTLMRFYTGYRDIYNTGWYRVKIGDTGEGYIQTTNVSISRYSPTTERPKTNAKILSVNGSLWAPIYEYKDNKYIEITDLSPSPLFTGTKVQVVGTYDRNVKYTLIRYYDSDLGLLECYVETVYIEYNGLTVLHIVIIILLTLVLILLAAILIRRWYVKKKSITKL